MAHFEGNSLQPDARKDMEDRFIFVDPCRPARCRQRERRCAECKTSKTTAWRRNVNGIRLCNGCGLRAFRDRRRSETITPNSPLRAGPVPGDAYSPVLIVSSKSLSRNENSRLLGVSDSGLCQSFDRLAIGSGQAGQSMEAFRIEAPSFTSGSTLRALHNGSTQKYLADTIPDFFSKGSAPRGLSDGDSDPWSIPKHSSSISRMMVGTSMWNTHLVPYNTIGKTIDGKLSAEMFTPRHCNGEGLCQYRCPGCLQQLFSAGNPVSGNLATGFHDWLVLFQRHTTEVHYSALQQGSSVYVATENFVFECAGKTWKITAFAVLREQYEAQSSTSASLCSASEAAQSDLEFGFVCVPTNGYPQADRIEDWLDRQSLVKRIEAPRAKSALWDLGRLPAGSHHPDSTTFRYLRRSFLRFPIETSSGERTTYAYTPQILSGSLVHNFRCVHELTMLLKHVRSENRKEIFIQLKRKLRLACIKSCQMWFIGCFEGALSPYGSERAEFLQANMEYMRDTIVLYREAFRQINVDHVPHICLPEPCPSHLQPTFDQLVHSSKRALGALFSVDSVSSYIQSRRPTPDQLLNAAAVGYVQYKLCFSCHLLSEGQRARHNDVMWKRFAEERAKLFLRTNSKLIWNYLPLEVIETAEAKLNRAWDIFNLPSNFYLNT